MEAAVQQRRWAMMAVFFGPSIGLTALVVIGGLTGNPWLLVPAITVIWGLLTALPALARQERRATRWVAAACGSAGLALLVASIVLGNPWLFLAVTQFVVIGGIGAGVIYAVIRQVTRGPEPPAPASDDAGPPAV